MPEKKKIYAISALLAVILIGLGFGAGFLTHQYMAPTSEAGLQTPNAQAASQQADTVSATAKVERVTRYLYCGHETSRLEDARDFAGLDAQAVQNKINDCTLTYFSRERIVLTCEYGGYCPDHLVLRADDTGLGVYRTDPKTTQEVDISHFEISVDQLSAETRRMLEEGMPFENLSEIESFLEDLES